MTRNRILLLVLAAALCGCPTRDAAAPSNAEAVSQARSQLAERERKVQSYRFHGQTTDLASKESLGFTFVYRSPGKMRGETEGAAPHVFVFDGQQLRELDVKAKKLTTYDLAALPKEKADELLHKIFAPFAPEGFRAPLLPGGKGLTAERLTGEGDKPELKLAATVADGADHYDFAFRFRLPAMDLVEKEVKSPAGSQKTTIARQSCEPKLGLCFPVEIVESHDGQPFARTLLSDIAVNGPVTDADFALAVPPGGTEEKKSLAAAP